MNPSPCQLCHLYISDTQTETHTPASVHQHQSNQTESCARQRCLPRTDGSVWSCLFYFNLMHLSLIAYPNCLNDEAVYLCIFVCVGGGCLCGKVLTDLSIIFEYYSLLQSVLYWYAYSSLCVKLLFCVMMHYVLRCCFTVASAL